MGSELTKRTLDIWLGWMIYPIVLVGGSAVCITAEVTFFKWFGLLGGLLGLVAIICAATLGAAFIFARASLAKEGKSDD